MLVSVGCFTLHCNGQEDAYSVHTALLLWVTCSIHACYSDMVKGCASCCNVCLVDLRLVKEIRPGKMSPDFEKWSEEARRHDTSCCFILFYGREFRLKTLSLAGFYFKNIL